MDMFTSYGHIKKPKLNHRFFIILAWDSPFNFIKSFQFSGDNGLICTGSTLSNLNLPLSFHPLQAANCCRNSRLVVDKDDLK